MIRAATVVLCSSMICLGCTTLMAQVSIKVAVAPLENKAGLTDDEIDVLSNSINSTFLGRVSSQMEVVVLENHSQPCDMVCLSERASTQGANKLVTGSIVSFGGAYTVKLEARDLATNGIVAAVNSAGVSTVVELLSVTQSEASKMASSLMPTVGSLPPPPAPATAPKPHVPRPLAARPAPPPAWSGSTTDVGATGRLNISSEPTGAYVRIGGKDAGKTPSVKNLEQGVYDIEVSKKSFGSREKRVTVFIGETKNLHFRLKPYGTLLRAGHTMFWPGLFLAGTGIVLSLAMDDNSPELPMAVGLIGGAMMATGATLWIVRGLKIKKSKGKKKRRGVTLLPTREKGFVAGYSQTF